MSDLSSYLDTAKGERSIDAVVAKAKNAGHKIDRATVARYVAGDGAKNPPDTVLRALAAGLDLDVRDLRALAGRPRGELGPFVPVDEAARLNDDQRRAINQLIKTIVASTAVEPVVEVPGRDRSFEDVYAAQRANLQAVADEGDAADADEIDEIARRARLKQTGRED